MLIDKKTAIQTSLQMAGTEFDCLKLDRACLFYSIDLVPYAGAISQTESLNEILLEWERSFSRLESLPPNEGYPLGAIR